MYSDNYVYNYATPHLYKIRDFIPLNKIDWELFYTNQNIILYIEKYIRETLATPMSEVGRSSTEFKRNTTSPNGDSIFLQKPDIFDQINWGFLSLYANAVPFLEKHIDKVSWTALSRNPKAIHILEKNLDKLDETCWGYIEMNKNAIPIIESNLDKINWIMIYRNPSAIHLIEKQFAKDQSYITIWGQLCLNENAMPIIEKYPDKIWWESLSMNPSAIPFLEKNLDKIKWSELCRNVNGIPLIEKCLASRRITLADLNSQYLSWNINAIPLLEKHPELIDWVELSANVNAFPLLEKNPDKICWMMLSINPGIFELDYDVLKQRIQIYKEDLIAAAMHPRRIKKIMELMGSEESSEENDWERFL
jgi:hypothetical protein